MNETKLFMLAVALMLTFGIPLAMVMDKLLTRAKLVKSPRYLVIVNIGAFLLCSPFVLWLIRRVGD